MSEKLKKINKWIHTTLELLEQLIAIILIISVIACCIVLAAEVIQFENIPNENFLHDILSYAFSIVIVIEFIRMLAKHSMDTVIEILIFALARGLIIGHESAEQMVVSILSIGILFVCRKFLFHPSDFEKQ